MNTEQQINEVIRIIHDEWKLNVENKPFFLNPDKLQHCPDYEAILIKLQKQCGIIAIKQKPNKHNMSDADIYLAEDEVGKSNINKYLSYSILVQPDFQDYYNNISQLQSNTLIKLKHEDIKLTTESYVKAQGLLFLTPNDKVKIAKNGKSMKSTNKKYFECYLLDCLFKGETQLKNGVVIHSILKKHSSIKLEKNEFKKVRNARTSINNKVKEVGGPNGLVKIHHSRVYINPLYLLKN